MAWEPTRTKNMRASAIKKSDIVMNNLGSAWLYIDQVDTEEDRIVFLGRKVLSMTNGVPELGEQGRLSALFDEERVIGW